MRYLVAVTESRKWEAEAACNILYSYSTTTPTLTHHAPCVH